MAETAPLRVGIIGVGWGTVVQTPAFGAVPEFEVAALCSRRAESVEAAGAKLGIADTSTDSMGSHDIDYTCALFGDPVEVCADIRTSTPRRTRDDGSELQVDADDTAVLLVRMANGATVSITTTAIALNTNFRAYEAYGSDGSLTMSGGLMGPEAEMQVVAGRVGQAEAERIDPPARPLRSGVELPQRRATPAIRALALMLEDWLPAFENQPTTVPTLADGHRVARVIDAARASAAGAGWVRLEEQQ